MRFASFAFLLIIVTFHDGVSSARERRSINRWNYRNVLSNFDKCIYNNVYSENRLPALKSRKDYDYINVPSREIISNIRVNDQGPLTMQGMFWLNVPGEAFKEVATFASTQEGGGLSTGTLSDTGPTYTIRHVGDRTWAASGFPRFLAEYFDGFIEFWLTEGTLTNPTKFQLFYDFNIPGTCLRYRTNDCPIAQLNFTLQNTPFDNDEFPSHELYDSSVVWFREQTGALDFTYEAIQIVDGAGNILQPAYDDFVQLIDDNGGFLNVGVLRSDAKLSECAADNDS